MGTGTTDEGHAIPAVRLAMQYTAAILPDASRALDAFESRCLHRGALDRSFAEQLPDSRTHEDLERHQGADRISRQTEDRHVVAEMAETLRLSRLHRDAGERNRAEFRECLFDDVERAHAHTTGGHEYIGAQQLTFKHVQQLRVIIRHDADPVCVRSRVPCSRRER